MVVLIKVLNAIHSQPPTTPMSSSTSYTIVDQFDDDEVPDIPQRLRRRSELWEQCPIRGRDGGNRTDSSTILIVAACEVYTGARSFFAIAESAAEATPAALPNLEVIGDKPCKSHDLSDLERGRRGRPGRDRRHLGRARGHHARAVRGHRSRRQIATRIRRCRCWCRYLLAALTHTGGMVFGQRDVDVKTSEVPSLGSFRTALNYPACRSPPTYCAARKSRPRTSSRNGGALPAHGEDKPADPASATGPACVGRCWCHRHPRRPGARADRKSDTQDRLRRQWNRVPARRQSDAVTRKTRSIMSRKWRTETVYAVTDLRPGQAGASPSWAPAYKATRHSKRLHWVCDITFGQNLSHVCTDNGPQVMGSLCNLTIELLRLARADQHR